MVLKLGQIAFTSVLFFGAVSEAAAARCSLLINESARSEGIEMRVFSEQEIRARIESTSDYQDGRNEKWTEQRKCLCCHTTLPFVLNRSYDERSKASFDRMYRLTVRSVEDGLSRPWYRADQAGRNSRPTEAVLNSLTLLMYDIKTGQQLSPTTAKSLAQIFEHMDADGHLHWLDFKLEPFESKNGENWGNAMAVLAVEMAKKHFNYMPPAEAYAKLANQLLSKKQSFHLNEKAVLIWADSMGSGRGQVLSQADRSGFIGDLFRRQNTDGSWNQKDSLGLGSQKPDVYATAMAVIALTASGNANSPAVRKAVNWLMSHNVAGSFSATSINRPRADLNNGFATDVATSYATLALTMYNEAIHRR